MTKIATIIGYGDRGQVWAQCAVRAGWGVRIFDPECQLGSEHLDITQHNLISTAVEDVEWIVLCLPDRLFLQQKMIQHIQMLCPKQTMLCVMSRESSCEDLQGCAKWPGAIVHVEMHGDDALELSMTTQNDAADIEKLRDTAVLLGFQVRIGGASFLAAE